MSSADESCDTSVGPPKLMAVTFVCDAFVTQGKPWVSVPSAVAMLGDGRGEAPGRRLKKDVAVDPLGW